MPMMEHTKLTIRSENYFILFVLNRPWTRPSALAKKVDGDGKKTNDEKIGNGLEWFGMKRVLLSVGVIFGSIASQGRFWTVSDFDFRLFDLIWPHPPLLYSHQTNPQKRQTEQKLR